MAGSSVEENEKKKKKKHIAVGDLHWPVMKDGNIKKGRLLTLTVLGVGLENGTAVSVGLGLMESTV